MGEIQIENIALDCNRLAMEQLSKGNLKSCLHLIRRAQDILNTPDFLESKNKLMAITYNNLGCYHKANNKNNLALQAFLKALDLKSDKLLDKIQAAEIHINICSIRIGYSQYADLVTHAKNALELLKQAEVFSKELTPKAYYYLGKGFQGANQSKNALKIYKIGLELAYKELGHLHPITCLLLKSYLELSTTESITDKTSFETFQMIKKGNSKVNIDELPKSTKKYVFEHNHSKSPEHFSLASNASIIQKQHHQRIQGKNTPVKAGFQFMDDFYFIDDENEDTELSSEKANKSNTDNLNISGSLQRQIKKNSDKSDRSTPENNQRSSSSQAKRLSETGLPKIRSATNKKRPNSSLDNKIKQKKPPSTLNEELLYEKKEKNSLKSFQPVPPTLPRKKPPASARASHFRKPSSESLYAMNDIIGENSISAPVSVQMPAIIKPKQPSLLQIILIQRI